MIARPIESVTLNWPHENPQLLTQIGLLEGISMIGPLVPLTLAEGVKNVTDKHPGLVNPLVRLGVPAVAAAVGLGVEKVTRGKNTAAFPIAAGLVTATLVEGVRRKALEPKRITSEKHTPFARVINGPEHSSDRLLDKQWFADKVIQLGYRAPVSIEVGHHELETVSVGTVSARFGAEQATFYTKPKEDIQGQGGRRHANLEEAIERLHGESETMLLQSDETASVDMRWVLHRDENNPTELIRISYEKRRPKVVGDGTSTVLELIVSDRSIPVGPKDLALGKLEKLNQTLLSCVPEAGQVWEAPISGNISQGAIAKMAEGTQLEYIDRFMLQFTADLKDAIGVDLSTVCYDIGVIDESIFDGEYDFERMRDNVVFYEFQVPFGVQGYLTDVFSPEEGASRLKRARSTVRQIALTLMITGSSLSNEQKRRQSDK